MSTNIYLFEVLSSLSSVFVCVFNPLRTCLERGRDASMWERSIHCFLYVPYVSVCVLTRNRTSNPFAHRMTFNLLSHPSWTSLSVFKALRKSLILILPIRSAFSSAKVFGLSFKIFNELEFIFKTALLIQLQRLLFYAMAFTYMRIKLIL